ncbi:MAG: hypothetical protein MMC33_006113 [Icmadophila ericetorum]|nr:hypothetical protein [Icmadophila ericetorum]
MAGGKHLYPRATFKRILKSNTKLRLSKNVDILVFLDYVLFMEELMKEAAIEAKKNGEKGVSKRAVMRVAEV